MPSFPLSAYLRPGPDRGPRDVPVLVWEAPTTEDELVLMTELEPRQATPSGSEPVVFELRKSASNPFQLGVTLGRAANNDLILDVRSVSRFHAYFQQAPGKPWRLVDANSKCGSWVDHVRLVPNHPTVLNTRAHVKVGEVALLYFEPDAFLEYAAQRLRT